VPGVSAGSRLSILLNLLPALTPGTGHGLQLICLLKCIVATPTVLVVSSCKGRGSGEYDATALSRVSERAVLMGTSYSSCFVFRLVSEEQAGKSKKCLFNSGHFKGVWDPQESVEWRYVGFS